MPLAAGAINQSHNRDSSPQLFAAPPNSDWDVTADGKRFLTTVSPPQGSQTPINVVLNWPADLKK
jgi:hypothetical protein